MIIDYKDPVSVLKVHIALWDWLAGHKRRETQCWPEWDYNGGEVESNPMSSSVLCEYARQNYPLLVAPPPSSLNGKFDCVSGCLLKEFWGKYTRYSRQYMCGNVGTPYYGWKRRLVYGETDPYGKTSAEYAIMIADAGRDKLNELLEDI